jgi:sensor histidine kinase YesM
VSQIKNVFKAFVQNRILQHILFWCLSYYYLLHFFSPQDIERIDYIYTAVFHFPLLVGVYLNLYLLIPWLLHKKRYLLYVLLVIAVVALTAALNIFIFNTAVDYFFPGYFFISYYGFYDLVQFSFVYVALTTLLKLSRAWFKLRESENYLVRVQKEKKDAELLFLRTQINPHFLFNSLNSIYSLSLKNDRQTPAVVLKLAEVMRYMTYESGNDFVPLEKEISYIRNYIELQQLRAPGDATVLFEVNGTPAGHKIAPFIFIVFIENGFKHGIQAGITGMFIHIRIDITEKELLLTAENSVGVKAEEGYEEFSGLGLNNVRQRLDLLYPGKHDLLVKAGRERYKIQLRLVL